MMHANALSPRIKYFSDLKNKCYILYFKFNNLFWDKSIDIVSSTREEACCCCYMSYDEAKERLMSAGFSKYCRLHLSSGRVIMHWLTWVLSQGELQEVCDTKICHSKGKPPGKAHVGNFSGLKGQHHP